MSVNAILACDRNFGIGNKGDLPWPRNDVDMEWFRKLTTDHVVVMGRTTWVSIGNKRLPHRTNVVVSSKNLDGPDLTLSGNVRNILDYVAEIYPGLHIWIIGGADIYDQALPYCDKVYLTTFGGIFECDRYIDANIISDFPEVEYFKRQDDLTFQIRRR